MPIGTKKTGFVKADQGPFLCANCEYWISPIGCGHPLVVADPEVAKIRGRSGKVYGRAEAKDCCNEFEPLVGKLREGEFK